MYIQLDPMIFVFCYQLTAAMIHNIHTIYICKRTINHKKQRGKLGSKNKKASGQSWAVNMAKIHENNPQSFTYQAVFIEVDYIYGLGLLPLFFLH